MWMVSTWSAPSVAVSKSEHFFVHGNGFGGAARGRDSRGFAVVALECVGVLWPESRPSNRQCLRGDFGGLVVRAQAEIGLPQCLKHGRPGGGWTGKLVVELVSGPVEELNDFQVAAIQSGVRLSEPADEELADGSSLVRVCSVCLRALVVA